VPNSDLAANRTIRRRYPMVCAALLSGASGPLPNLATVGFRRSQERLGRSGGKATGSSFRVVGWAAP
jgi:hypothetical protein